MRNRIIAHSRYDPGMWKALLALLVRERGPGCVNYLNNAIVIYFDSNVDVVERDQPQARGPGRNQKLSRARKVKIEAL